MSSGHTLKLNSGHDMDIVGLGTWKSKPDEVRHAVESAIDCGYRHIDCAWCYQNEHEVGVALENKVKEGKVKREDLFITSKLWCTFHEPDQVRKGCMESLKSLKLDYLDLYLVHNPVGYIQVEGNPFPLLDNGKMQNTDRDYMDTWKAMEMLVEEGLVKSIGISNFNIAQTARVLKEGKIKPAVNQIEIHPNFTQEPLVEYCQKEGVVVTAYSPFASPDNPWLKEGYKPVLEDVTINEISKRMNKTPAQVILRYLMQRNLIVIPKSVTASRIESNYQVFNFKLDDADMAKISKLNKNYRTCLFEWDIGHKYYPFNENYKE